MRKYFVSALKNAGFDHDFVDFMAGHKPDATDRAYYWADAEQLKGQYKNCIPFLTIEKSLDISESEEFKKIKEHNKVLLIEAEKHRVERHEIQELKAQVAKLEQAAKEASKLEDEFDVILSEELKEKNHYPDIEAPEEYNIFLKKLNEDPEYKKKYEEFRNIYLSHFNEYTEKIKIRDETINKARKTLLDKL